MTSPERRFFRTLAIGIVGVIALGILEGIQWLW